MQSLEGIQKKIKTVHELLSVVKTMKSLAAVNIRQFEGAVASLEEFNRTIDMGWQVLFRDQSTVPRERKEGVVILFVFGSDQGMCGQYNESIIEFARQFASKNSSGNSKIFFWSMGERIRAGLEEQYRIAEHFNLPGSIQGINEHVGKIILQIDSWQQKAGIQSMHIFHNKIMSGGIYQPVQKQLFPLNEDWFNAYKEQKWPTKCLPKPGIAFNTFFSSLFQHYMFGALYRAFAQAMASENAARLAAMQAAEKNILELEEDLQARFRETRQSTITAEMFDIISGFEALGQEA